MNGYVFLIMLALIFAGHGDAVVFLAIMAIAFTAL